MRKEEMNVVYIYAAATVSEHTYYITLGRREGGKNEKK